MGDKIDTGIAICRAKVCRRPRLHFLEIALGIVFAPTRFLHRKTCQPAHRCY